MGILSKKNISSRSSPIVYPCAIFCTSQRARVCFLTLSIASTHSINHADRDGSDPAGSIHVRTSLLLLLPIRPSCETLG